MYVKCTMTQLILFKSQFINIGKARALTSYYFCSQQTRMVWPQKFFVGRFYPF